MGYENMVVIMLNSVVGALINVLMWSKKPSDITTWESIKSILIGLLIGYAYWWGYAYHGFPDGLMAIVAGYSGKDFIDWLIGKAVWIKNKNQPKKKI